MKLRQAKKIAEKTSSTRGFLLTHPIALPISHWEAFVYAGVLYKERTMRNAARKLGIRK